MYRHATPTSRHILFPLGVPDVLTRSGYKQLETNLPGTGQVDPVFLGVNHGKC